MGKYYKPKKCKCPYCPKSFPKARQLTSHISDSHKEESEKRKVEHIHNILNSGKR